MGNSKRQRYGLVISLLAFLGLGLFGLFSMKAEADLGEMGAPILKAPLAPEEISAATNFDTSARANIAELEPSPALPAISQAGQVSLHFVSENLNPIEGVQAILLPIEDKDWDNGWKNVSQKLSAKKSWRQSSDRDGIVLWEKLDTSKRYRWGLLSSHTLEITPKHEKEEYTPVENGFVSKGEPPRGLSGILDLQTTSRLDITVPVYSESGFFGQIDAGANSPSSPIRLQVFSRTRIAGIGSEELVSFEQESYGRTDEQGKFAVRGCRPGHKTVIAAWNDGQQNFSFARTAFEVKPGEFKDCGTISPMQGESQKARVLFRRDGGEEIEPERLFENAENLRATVSVGGEEEPAKIDSVFQHFLFVDIGKPFTLQGLFPGEWKIKAMTGEKWPSLRKGFRFVEDNPEVTISTGRKGLTEIGFLVEEVLDATMTFHLPMETPPAEFSVFAQALTTGRLREARIRTGEESTAIVELSLTAGTHRVLVTPRMRGKGVAANLFFAGEITADLAQPQIDLGSLQKGSEIVGRVLDREGRPMSDQIVQLALQTWTIPGNTPWTLSARTDALGNFRVVGAPTNSNFLFKDFDNWVRTGEPGTKAEITLASRRGARQTIGKT